jgi:hypothetical protein
MKKIGSILLAIAALSLLGALFSAGRDADTAGGRFMGALILGCIGFLLLYFGNKTEDTQHEKDYRTTGQNQSATQIQEQSAQTNDSQMKFRNKMSARELVSSENATLKFVENPNTGKVFFTCGSKKGYVSPAALEHMEQGELDDFHYAEVSMDGKTYVPCLMLVNKPTEKIIRSFDVKNDNITEKRYGLQPCSISKKLEIKRQLYSLMLHFIQTEYGDISVTAENIDDLNILSIPLANARTCYEDNESFIHTCNLYGLDYSEILEEASKQIFDYYMSKNKHEDTDLPF